MTNYNKVFEEKQYRSVTDKAAKYYQETAKSGVIPAITADVFDALEYTYVDLTDPQASHAGLDWYEKGRIADVIHEPTTYKLFSHMMFINIKNQDIAKYGDWLIADKKEASISKMVLDIDNAMFHGPKNDQGLQLAEGIIGQLTSMENLNGTNSNLATKGYIWKAINKMVDGIPFALREEGPDMVLFMSEHIYSKACAPDRVYMEKTEWQLIQENMLAASVPKGRRISQIILTNKILAEASDDTDGDNADTVDTEGTHDRMLLFVPDSRWIARVISRGFSLVGEESHMLHVEQLYGWRGRAVIFNTNCAEYTEALVWA